jgi:hypothetical protein
MAGKMNDELKSIWKEAVGASSRRDHVETTKNVSTVSVLAIIPTGHLQIMRVYTNGIQPFLFAYPQI